MAVFCPCVAAYFERHTALTLLLYHYIGAITGHSITLQSCNIPRHPSTVILHSKWQYGGYSQGLFQKLSLGGPQALFCPVGGGCYVDNVSEGWGVTCPGGSRHIWSIVGRVKGGGLITHAFRLLIAWQHHRRSPAGQPRTTVSGGSGR